ncbi:dethiobiotin synthase [Endozoicomonas sp. SM1973]|uniref:ATP-dependent dethiobiotin synthetase BioD n=1 Tax=Spartinivicinus marinus TaxID=2994442 RepID=A0A853I3S6_9GAMM|nr:dethiobiotin synthase [Spartinivicinus marinus]MCX4026376.1 dethiobiotin synthase [Spartinivicinus marinus]NYZ67279.1 dethiobiotin synthase [Spartinivicinus marinus]
MTKPFFVTGTDTEVGKTLISCGLLHKARQQGLSTIGLKPVAAGCNQTVEGLQNEDALGLQQCSTVKLPYQQVNPIALEPPVAPHIAAAEINKPIRADRLVGYCRGALMQPADFKLIEGAGGWRVPLNYRETLADVAKQLNCQVIVVVGMKLGCINHALLTYEAVVRDGLTVAGWVANQVQPEMSHLEANIETLQQMLPTPCLGVVPYQEQPTPESVSAYLKLPSL